MRRPCAIVCPGQGSQSPGMLGALPDDPDIDRLLDAAEALSDMDLRAAVALGDAAGLSDTRVAQPLLYLCDWVWGRSLMRAGLEPLALAGHSLGEYSALALAGVFSVEAGLHLVVERSRIMHSVASRVKGTMAAVLALPRPRVDEVVESIDDLWVANDNCPGQTVISGTEEAVSLAETALLDAGAKRVVRLDVAGPFHSPLMAPAEEEFAATLRSAEFTDADIPVVQNTDPSNPTTDAESIRANLARQMTSPVRWTETMLALRSLGCEVLVEAGPGKVLTGLARRVEGLDATAAEPAGLAAVLEEVGAL